MARPRLEAADRRTRTIGVRVTAAEGVQLDERAEAARLTTATFVRQVVLGRPVRIAAVRRLGPAEFAELNRIGVEPEPDRPGPERRSARPGPGPGRRWSGWASS